MTATGSTAQCAATIHLCKTCASDMRAGEIVTCPPTVLLSLRQFLESFEAVFGETDWPVTLANLQNDAEYFIDPNGTFLEPYVEDESNNWGNRGALLAAYRGLQAELSKAQFNILRRDGMQ